MLSLPEFFEEAFSHGDYRSNGQLSEYRDLFCDIWRAFCLPDINNYPLPLSALYALLKYDCDYNEFTFSISLFVMYDVLNVNDGKVSIQAWR